MIQAGTTTTCRVFKKSNHMQHQKDMSRLETAKEIYPSYKPLHDVFPFERGSWK